MKEKSVIRIRKTVIRTLFSVMLVFTVLLTSISASEQTARLDDLRERMESRFVTLVSDSTEYENTVIRQSMDFPEADLFPLVYPGVALVRIAQQDPDKWVQYQPLVDRLIRMAVSSVENRLAIEPGSLPDLEGYREEAVYLGSLNLLLSMYHSLQPDSPW